MQQLNSQKENKEPGRETWGYKNPGKGGPGFALGFMKVSDYCFEGGGDYGFQEAFEELVENGFGYDHIWKCGHKWKSGVTTNRGSLCEIDVTNHEKGGFYVK